MYYCEPGSAARIERMSRDLDTFKGAVVYLTMRQPIQDYDFSEHFCIPWNSLLIYFPSSQAGFSSERLPARVISVHFNMDARHGQDERHISECL